MALNRYELLERLRELLATQEGAEPAGSKMSANASLDHCSVERLDLVHHPVLEAQPATQRMLLTVPEACAELRISRAQLYILTNKQHVIDMIHIGKLSRIPRASLEAYVEQLRQKQRTAPRLAFDRELCA